MDIRICSFLEAHQMTCDALWASGFFLLAMLGVWYLFIRK